VTLEYDPDHATLTRAQDRANRCERLLREVERELYQASLPSADPVEVRRAVLAAYAIAAEANRR
jgi:hypothetical protein